MDRPDPPVGEPLDGEEVALVEAERLAAIPWTRFSADSQRELEATGSVARTKFGARGSWNEPSASEDAEGGSDEAEAA